MLISSLLWEFCYSLDSGLLATAIEVSKLRHNLTIKLLIQNPTISFQDSTVMSLHCTFQSLIFSDCRENANSLASCPGLRILWENKGLVYTVCVSIILTQILLNRLFPSKSMCCLHHCHEVANSACLLSEVLSFPKCISYAIQMLCPKNTTLTEQLRSVIEDFMVGISTTDGTDGSSLHC